MVCGAFLGIAPDDVDAALQRRRAQEDRCAFQAARILDVPFCIVDATTLTDCGGSADDPLFVFEYEERAFHHFVIEGRWAGQAIDENGLVHILDPDFLAVQYTFDWETVEVRSSLDG